MNDNDGQHAVAIFGSGRSGTTWVQDVLAEANEYCTVFEPLHPEDVPGAAAFANRYVAAGTDDAELSAFMREVLTGRIAPLWTRMRVRRNRLLPRTEHVSFMRAVRNLRVTYVRLYKNWRQDRRIRHRPRIVKFIRGNLLAEWLVTEFRIPAAVVVRHPCAVLQSVIRRSGNEWSIEALRTVLDTYLAQRDLADGPLAGVAGELGKLRSFAGVNTAIWCIENAAFVGDSRPANLHVAHYEDLVCDRPGAWAGLVDALGLKNVPDARLRLRPSQQAGYPLLQDFSNERLLSGWQRKLDDGQKAEVAAVLALFGIRVYSVEDPLPLRFAGTNPQADEAHGFGG